MKRYNSLDEKGKFKTRYEDDGNGGKKPVKYEVDENGNEIKDESSEQNNK